MISVSDAHVTFNQGTPNESKALRGISLTIDSGEFVTVIGSNGAGKSTLLNAIAGDIPLDSGSVVLDGTDVTRKRVHERASDVARVFQDPLAGTCGSLSIEENMALALKRRGARSLRPALRSTNKAMMSEQLHKLGLGLEHRLADTIGLLSGGQRQAVSLLMATLAPSKILLLDEHTAALDPHASATVLGLTERFVRELKLTTLMITHSMKDALNYGDRLIMLHKGQIIFQASGAEKSRLTVSDLLDRFSSLAHGAVDNDSLLLN